MKIFIVIHSYYDGYEVLGARTSFDAANELMKEVKKNFKNATWFDIWEMEIDKKYEITETAIDGVCVKSKTSIKIDSNINDNHYILE